MDKKKKTAIIIAAIIVIAAVAVTVVLATNKKDDPIYEDTYVAVTDENGDVIFDEDGNVVTELASKPVSSTEKTTAPKNNKTTAKSSTTSSGKTDSNNNGNSNNNNSAAKDDTTKKPTETQTEKKPEKRDVTLEINLPYYYDPAKNGPRECEFTVNVCIDGEWNKIDLNDYDFTITGGDNKNSDDDVKAGKIKLDRATITIDLGKIKGVVEAAVDITNVTALKNSSSVDEFGDTIIISPVTGVESMEGIDD